MSTQSEIRATLTGPGGPFEVVVDTVDGIEMKVYKDRLSHLRAVAEIAALRGDDQPFLVYGDERIGFSEFFRRVNQISGGLAKHFGIGQGDRVAVLSANNPEWCETFWATVNLGAV
jgi:acyl-CoA synthetase (AMP-forming)/AMP-acid ligase II